MECKSQNRASGTTWIFELRLKETPRQSVTANSERHSIESRSRHRHPYWVKHGKREVGHITCCIAASAYCKPQRYSLAIQMISACLWPRPDAYPENNQRSFQNGLSQSMTKKVNLLRGTLVAHIAFLTRRPSDKHICITITGPCVNRE